MKTGNPFLLPEVAAGYESWYEGPGKSADLSEKALLSRLLRGFPEAQSILEIGCGTGHFTRWFESQGLWSVGVDISLPMLKEAKGRDTVAGLVQAEATSLPFPSNSFDLTALITSLEFMEERLSVLAEAIRVAREGVLLGVLNRASLLAVWRKLEGYKRPTPYSHAHFFTLKELKAMLEDLLAPEEPKIEWATTLLPVVGGVHKVPWGGFLGIAVYLDKQNI